MEFDYNYTKCQICESKMIELKKDKTICKNGCCMYNFQTDIERKSIFVTIFDEQGFIKKGYTGSSYLLDKYENSYVGGSLLPEELKELRIMMETNLLDFLKEVNYWKENDRYLMRIMGVSNENK
ncbi:hypothetical protein D3C87_76460 [compost metagenome]